jgi:hypothetical protein
MGDGPIRSHRRLQRLVREEAIEGSTSRRAWNEGYDYGNDIGRSVAGTQNGYLCKDNAGEDGT